MEAKDTVIKMKWMTKDEWLNALLLKQAKKTESMLKEQWKQDGIKEVVNWMNLNCLGCRSNTRSNTDEYLGFHKESWQAQLKEWFATKNGG